MTAALAPQHALRASVAGHAHVHAPHLAATRARPCAPSQQQDQQQQRQQQRHAHVTHSPVCACRRHPAHPVVLATAAPSGASAGDGEPAAGLLVSAQQQGRALGALALLHGALAVATTLAPGWALQQLLGLPVTTATRLQLLNAGAYFWLLCACLVCLKQAASHARLASDTYRRLGLGVMYQCVICGILLLRHKGLLAGSVLGCGLGVFGVTALAAGRVYAESSAAGFSPPTIARSFAANLLDCARPRGPVSAFYGASAALALLQCHTAATPLFTTDLGPVALLLKQARGAGMVLSGVVWYTLKDAADRGRLAATTFKQLNLAMAAVAALQLWGLYQMADVGVPLNQQLWKVLMATGAAALAVCDVQFLCARAPAGGA